MLDQRVQVERVDGRVGVDVAAEEIAAEQPAQHVRLRMEEQPAHDREAEPSADAGQRPGQPARTNGRIGGGERIRQEQ